MKLLHSALTIACVFTLDIFMASAQEIGTLSQVLPGPAVLERCDDDSLGDSEARGRVEWFARCHPEIIIAAERGLAGESISETDAFGEFYRDMMYKFDGTQWVPRYTHSKYPSFINPETMATWREAPTNKDSQCVPIPAGFIWKASCRSSCYAPEQQILFPEGLFAIKQAFEQKLPSVMVVDEESTMEKVTLSPIKLSHYTISRKDGKQEILVFRTLSGGKLKVTPNHPLLDQEGIIREASSFKAGDSLIRLQGGRDLIVSIEPETFFGRVYNLAPRTESLVNNIVVAEGFLSGSELYQNEFNDQMNRRIFRATLPDSLVE
jgi:hypothetical protein